MAAQTVVTVATICPQDFISNDLRTTSLKVAEAFGKRHDDVLRKLKSLDCSDNYRARNFAETFQQVKMPKGGVKNVPLWEMTKDGFMFLVMGFTGKKAAAIKEAYIDAFNRMEQQLRHSTSNIDHTAILRAAIHGRASSFPEPERRSVISRLWHEVHKEFGVFRASDIPAEQAAEVCGFVASRPLEGEYLPRSEPVAEGFVSLSEQDCHDTFHVLHHLGCIEKDMTRLIGLSQTTESPWMSGTIEHLRASTMMAKNLRARKSEIRDAYQATIRKIN